MCTSNVGPFLRLRAGTFIEAAGVLPINGRPWRFPFLFGRAFIEASPAALLHRSVLPLSLPFLGGLSLRRLAQAKAAELA